MADVSRNCRDELCTACTGCDHECHHVPPPEQLREIYQEAKEGGQ